MAVQTGCAKLGEDGRLIGFWRRSPMYATVFFENDFSVRLTFALLHLLWQGTVVAIFVWIANGYLARSTARARYLVSLAGLISIALCLPVTFLASSGRAIERNTDVAS